MLFLDDCVILKKKINKKSVTINKEVTVILIPCKEEYIEKEIFNDLWYTTEQLFTMKNEAIFEVRCYATLKNITCKEAVKTMY